ncbi:MAG: hypothetical protein J6P61_03725 [Erysipelotrichaceae bacterium]|nr:hypothetical protein [Erysipelotrichaceae bacterium]
MNWNFVKIDGFPEKGKQVVLLTENCNTILGERTKDHNTSIEYWKGKSYEDNHRLNKSKVIGWMYVPDIPPVAEVKKLCGDEKLYRVGIPTSGVLQLWGRGKDETVGRERADLEADMRGEELGLKDTKISFKSCRFVEFDGITNIFNYYYNVSGTYITLVHSDNIEDVKNVALERWMRQDWPMLLEKSHGEMTLEER